MSERQTYLQKGYHFDKVKAEADQLKSELAERDKWVEQTFGQSHNLHDWKQYTQAVQQTNQQQTQQQSAGYDQQTGDMVQQMQAAGYDQLQIQMYVDQRGLAKQNQMLSQELTQLKTSSKQEREQETQARNMVEGARILLGDYEQLTKDYGDMLPKIEGNTPLEKWDSLYSQLDPETQADIQRGMPFKKAFIANNHDTLLKKQQELTEQRTVANISDRAKKGADTNKTEVKTTENKMTDRQKALAKIFGVPASEVAKRI